MKSVTLTLLLLLGTVHCGGEQNETEGTASPSVNTPTGATPAQTGTTPNATPTTSANGEPLTAGTRLSVVKLNGADGSSYTNPQLFFDNTLQTQCSPHLAVDGVTRCLPMISSSTEGVAYFLDAACSKPAYVFPCHLFAPFYYVEASDFCAGSPLTSYRSGAEVPASSAYSRDLPNGTCERVQAGFSFFVYEAGAVVAPSTFVAFTPASKG